MIKDSLNHYCFLSKSMNSKKLKNLAAEEPSEEAALVLPAAIYRYQLLEEVTESTLLHKDLSNVVCRYLLLQDVIVSSTSLAFAAVLASGRVVTWGDARYGGDSSSVQAELKDQFVQHICATEKAFAAVLASGRVVTWENNH